MHWFTLLHAQLSDADGSIVAVANGYLTRENMLPFHDAKLSISVNDDELTITTDKFARSVELCAGENGSAFGWVFEDNFFDLFPFESKKVKIQMKGAGNTVLAQAHYSPHVSKISV